MKIVNRSVFGFLFLAFVGAALLVSPIPTFAGLASIHGHSGRIENESIVTDPMYSGTGLSFTVNLSKGVWVHYAVPIPLGSTTRYTGVRFSTDSPDIMLKNIHVWNGGTRVGIFDNLTGLSGNTQWKVIDLGSYVTIDMALGVSLYFQAGDAPASHKVSIYAVGAEYLP